MTHHPNRPIPLQPMLPLLVVLVLIVGMVPLLFGAPMRQGGAVRVVAWGRNTCALHAPI